jgi:hypothetical protein
VQRINLGLTNVEYMEDLIEEAARVGRWVIIENIQYAPRNVLKRCLKQVRSQMYQTYSIKLNFKLWIIYSINSDNPQEYQFGSGEYQQQQNIGSQKQSSSNPFYEGVHYEGTPHNKRLIRNLF